MYPVTTLYLNFHVEARYLYIQKELHSSLQGLFLCIHHRIDHEPYLHFLVGGWRSHLGSSFIEV